MIFLPPRTVEEKVAALRACMPGVNLYNFLKGMPTALARSKETVPRGMSQLREVSGRFMCVLEAQVTRGEGLRGLVVCSSVFARNYGPDGHFGCIGS